MHLNDLVDQAPPAEIAGTPLQYLKSMTSSARGARAYVYRETDVNPETGLALEEQVISAAPAVWLVQAVEAYLESIGETPYGWAPGPAAPLPPRT